MQKQFEKFCENIKLTSKQREDAKKKYSGVCKKLHDHFYDCDYSGNTKLLFGSYARVKRTAIRPLSGDQDVDVLFKIPEDVFGQYCEYEKGGQSALLQKIRDILLDSKYSLGEKPKAWGKVILVKTKDGTHNVELLPALEHSDKSFTIPNSEDGGSWEPFDPRTELQLFKESNEETSGLTGDLSRVIKRWAQEISSISLKSYEIENFVIDFLGEYDFDKDRFSEIVKDFFDYLYEEVGAENESYARTAKERSLKAFGFENEQKLENATEEWKKVFGKSSFPSRASVYKNKVGEVKSPNEEFIEEQIAIGLDPNYSLKIDCNLEQKGFRVKLLSQFPDDLLRKEKSLIFFIKRTNIEEPFSVKWKVRNFGKEAEDANDLRGQIYEDNGRGERSESTKYSGEHFVECYLIKNKVCVARDKIMVPIGRY